MLVIERKDNEIISVFVEGQEVTFNLIACQGGKAKIGIDAPEEALILRGELLDQPPESIQQHA